MNTPNRKVIHRKAEYWQDKISQWKSCNLTQAEFCDQHGLAMSTFHNWQKKLRTEGVPEGEQPLPQPFIELPVESLSHPDPEHQWDLELSLGNGITLRMRQS